MAEVESSDESVCGQNGKDKPKIIIIGAGIAGIAAANTLINAGLTDFEILEATDRVGGRIWSIDLETAPGRKAELGANWIHGIDANPIFKIATQHNLLSKLYEGRKLGKRLMFLRENGQPVNTKIVEEVDWHYGMLMSQCEDFYQMHEPTPYEDDTVGGFIERGFEEKFDRYQGEQRHIREMILKQRLIGECIISGSGSMHDIALSEVGSFQELPGVHFVIPPGFESVVQILSRDIPQKSIHLNHIVSQIKWNKTEDSTEAGINYPVCIECANGQVFYADHVLVTLPLGYLKQHHARLFSPALPSEKLGAIDRIAYGTVNKVILEFDDQVLPNEVFRVELIWDRSNINEDDLSQTWYKKLGCFEAVADNVLMGWVSGREAEYMESLSEEEVGSTCVRVLQDFLQHSGVVLPKLKRTWRTQWKKSPYSLGSYCYIPVGAYAEDVDLLAEPVTPDNGHKPALLFAGDSTHTCFYSSSHGALLSGEREAHRLMSMYGYEDPTGAGAEGH